MAEPKRGFGGQPADMTQLDMIDVGPLSFAVEYRHVGGEEGPSVHVFGEVGAETRRLLAPTRGQREPAFALLHLEAVEHDTPVEQRHGRFDGKRFARLHRRRHVDRDDGQEDRAGIIAHERAARKNHESKDAKARTHDRLLLEGTKISGWSLCYTDADRDA